MQLFLSFILTTVFSATFCEANSLVVGGEGGVCHDTFLAARHGTIVAHSGGTGKQQNVTFNTKPFILECPVTVVLPTSHPVIIRLDRAQTFQGWIGYATVSVKFYTGQDVSSEGLFAEVTKLSEVGQVFRSESFQTNFTIVVTSQVPLRPEDPRSLLHFIPTFTYTTGQLVPSRDDLQAIVVASNTGSDDSDENPDISAALITRLLIITLSCVIIICALIFFMVKRRKSAVDDEEDAATNCATSNATTAAAAQSSSALFEGNEGPRTCLDNSEPPPSYEDVMARPSV